ncbi:MAG: hypothetical protein JSV99_00795 [Planctomycetota bacterium]|nr:MAG: hypothetical protein JSV99_00795 [Planctomycetota bacterium]
MIIRKINYGKILAVVFITVLIWVWADLALDEELPDKTAVIVIDESATPKLWVSFNQSRAADIKITLSGPHAAIAEEKRKLRRGERLEFDFDAAQEKMDEPGSYALTLLPFLQRNKEIKRLGLKVKSCEPEKLDVQVVGLVKNSLIVECIDENRTSLKTESIDPSKIDMLVPEDWSGEKLIARVFLRRREIDQARLDPIEKVPYIELAPRQIRWAATPVKITMPPDEELLADHTITATTLGFTFSANLQGKYGVVVTNLDEVLGAINIRATADAKRAYEHVPYQVILEIRDEDSTSTEPLRRELIYNFPDQYLRTDEIRLNQQPVTARFELVSLPAVEAQ